jgi:hypothetical protein
MRWDTFIGRHKENSRKIAGNRPLIGSVGTDHWLADNKPIGVTLSMVIKEKEQKLKVNLQFEAQGKGRRTPKNITFTLF